MQQRVAAKKIYPPLGFFGAAKPPVTAVLVVHYCHEYRRGPPLSFCCFVPTVAVAAFLGFCGPVRIYIETRRRVFCEPAAAAAAATARLATTGLAANDRG